ncbi:hypothetical protein [Streptomyces sp. NBC_00239]|uniref:hypothetical protein n=1 Tax=Streptomyces sp. NBC_00239 TaxID=2903640 RepID=UPI002E28F529|nr:hypothetical protein [Streptomyces sp. NBC_00239]
MGITNVDRDDDGLAETARCHRRRQAAERLTGRGARGDFEPTREAREARKKAERELRAALVTIASEVGRILDAAAAEAGAGHACGPGAGEVAPGPQAGTAGRAAGTTRPA